jgi:hypothetical protein
MNYIHHCIESQCIFHRFEQHNDEDDELYRLFELNEQIIFCFNVILNIHNFFALTKLINKMMGKTMKDKISTDIQPVNTD